MRLPVSENPYTPVVKWHQAFGRYTPCGTPHVHVAGVFAPHRDGHKQPFSQDIFARVAPRAKLITSLPTSSPGAPLLSSATASVLARCVPTAWLVGSSGLPRVQTARGGPSPLSPRGSRRCSRCPYAPAHLRRRARAPSVCPRVVSPTAPERPHDGDPRERARLPLVG
jgi:hypothetical protein